MSERDDQLDRRQADVLAVKSLYRSLIVRALRDVVLYHNRRDKRSRRFYKEAYDWLYNDDQEGISGKIRVEDDISQDHARKLLGDFETLMSFDGVCALLGWNPQWVREMSKKLTPEDLARLSPFLDV